MKALIGVILLSSLWSFAQDSVEKLITVEMGDYEKSNWSLPFEKTSSFNIYIGNRVLSGAVGSYHVIEVFEILENNKSFKGDVVAVDNNKVVQIGDSIVVNTKGRMVVPESCYTKSDFALCSGVTLVNKSGRNIYLKNVFANGIAIIELDRKNTGKPTVEYFHLDNLEVVSQSYVERLYYVNEDMDLQFERFISMDKSKTWSRNTRR